MKSPVAGDSAQHVLSWGLYLTHTLGGKLVAIYHLWSVVLQRSKHLWRSPIVSSNSFAAPWWGGVSYIARAFLCHVPEQPHTAIMCFMKVTQGFMGSFGYLPQLPRIKRTGWLVQYTVAFIYATLFRCTGCLDVCLMLHGLQIVPLNRC